jgi:hypothetical protein
MTTYHPPAGAMRPPERKPPSTLAWRIGAVVWPSFFAAGVATMVFFAVVDPIALGEITWPRFPVTREVGYTVGFFMFWACTLSACGFTSLLLGPPASPPDGR